MNQIELTPEKIEEGISPHYQVFLEELVEPRAAYQGLKAHYIIQRSQYNESLNTILKGVNDPAMNLVKDFFDKVIEHIDAKLKEFRV
jgi:hypothetical protein